MSLFLDAARGADTERAPVWIMCQVGRYLPEYRALKEVHDFWDLVRTPELAREVTLQPVRRFGLDAAILFSDIMTPLPAMGVEIAFAPGLDIASPLRSEADVAALRLPEQGEIAPFVAATIELIREDCPVPLIGFGGAPLTLASYLIQGGGSKDFAEFRGFLRRSPAASHALLDRLTEVSIRYLRMQVHAGAQAIQLFDSWAGLHGRAAYAEFGLPYNRRLFEALADLEVPRIYLAVNAAHLYREIRLLPCEAVSVDWRMPLHEVRPQLSGKVLQGNLDPAALLGPRDSLVKAVEAVLRSGLRGPHIFNLGHGIFRHTDPDSVAVLRRYRARVRPPRRTDGGGVVIPNAGRTGDVAEDRRGRVATLMRRSQAELVRAFEAVDGEAHFADHSWQRTGGGGVRILEGGRVFERAGVNVSAVHGERVPPSLVRQHPAADGKSFFATGLSLVTHPRNPYVPAFHANLRYFEVGEAGQGPALWWFGGGADLTPSYPFERDVRHFRRSLKAWCDRHPQSDYGRFKTTCDAYFTLRHRNEMRGVSGIFYDELSPPGEGDFEADLAFTEDGVASLLPSYLPLVERHLNTPYGDRERHWQLHRRGRYVEFNLIYDRGTLFGLQTQGNVEAILMSMPPLAGWTFDLKPEPDGPEEQALTFFQPSDWIDEFKDQSGGSRHA